MPGGKGNEVEAVVSYHFEIEVASFGLSLLTAAENEGDLCVDHTTCYIVQNRFKGIAGAGSTSC